MHHIEPVEVNPDRAYDIDNLMSLCEACHNAAHPEKGGSRPRWDAKQASDLKWRG